MANVYCYSVKCRGEIKVGYIKPMPLPAEFNFNSMVSLGLFPISLAAKEVKDVAGCAMPFFITTSVRPVT